VVGELELEIEGEGEGLKCETIPRVVSYSSAHLLSHRPNGVQPCGLNSNGMTQQKKCIAIDYARPHQPHQHV
jgi:hypothetical protein